MHRVRDDGTHVPVRQLTVAMQNVKLIKEVVDIEGVRRELVEEAVKARESG